MRNKQQNYNVMALFAFFGLATTLPAFGVGAITRPGASEPLLRDGGPGPCDPGPEGADLVAGVDAGGHPVPPAGPQTRVPMPDQILVPLKNAGRRGRAGDAPMVALDGRALDPLLNPLPACPPAKR